MPIRTWLMRSVGAIVLVSAACQSPTPSAAPTTGQTTSVPTTTAPATSGSPASTPATIAPSAQPASSPAASKPSPAPTAVPTSAGRVEVLKAANEAYLARRYPEAAELYERILLTPQGVGEPPALRGWASFRNMLSLVLAGREEDAQQWLEQERASDPNGAFTRLEEQFWHTYGQTGDARSACAQLTPNVQTAIGSALAPMEALGIAAPPAMLCVVPAE